MRIVVDTGRAEADVAGSGALGATGSEVRRAGHPGRARRDPHRRLPLVCLRQPVGHDRGDVIVGEQRRGRGARVEADVGDLDLARELAARRQQQPGLQGGERDGALRPQHALRLAAGEAVDATRDVDGEHGR